MLSAERRRLRLVVVGQESAGARAMELALARGHEVRAVLTDGHLDSQRARSVASTARSNGIDLLDAASVRDSGLGVWLGDEGVDLLLNVHSLHIAHREVIEAPRIGSFNLHPGPLPRYPGLNAPSWAIYDETADYGCTVHWMDAGVDTGHVAYATTFPIEPSDTGLTLSLRCVREGIPLLGRLLDDAARGGRDAIPRVEQRGERLERGPGPPDDGRIVWSAPATRIASFVRACDYLPFTSPWGHPRTTTEDTEVEVLRASVEASSTPPVEPPGTVVGVDCGAVLVATGEGLLRVSRIRRGAEAVDAREVVRSGDRFDL